MMHLPKKLTALAVALSAGALTLVAVGGANAQSAPPRTAANTRLGAETTTARGRDVPGLAVDPSNASHFVEVEVDARRGRCVFNTSFDAGRTWAGGSLTAQAMAGDPPFRSPQEGYPDPSCDAVNAAHMDGSVVFGSGQNVYTAFATSRCSGTTPCPYTTPPGLQASEGNSVVVPRSLDGGRTFLAGTVAMRTPPGTSAPSYSRPEVAVQPGAGTNGADRVYVAANRSGSGVAIPARVMVAVSQDGGVTWGAPVETGTLTANEGSQPVVGPDGAVYVAWRTARAEPTPAVNPPLTLGDVKISKSVNAGVSWTTFQVAPVRGYGPDEQGNSFNSSTFPRIAVDPRPGTNNLYITYMQGPSALNPPGVTPTPAPRAAGVSAQDHFIHPDADVAFVRSTNGAQSWSAPIRINDDPVGTGAAATGPAQRHPRVSVAPNGRVDVVWQDRRYGFRSPTNSHIGDGEARFGDTFYAFSADQGQTFSVNRRVSDKSQNLDIGLDLLGGIYWNFAPTLLSFNNEVVFAWQDSREGNTENGNDDIYLARLDMPAPAGSIPVQALPEGSNAAVSVALSKWAYSGGQEPVLNPNGTAFTPKPTTKIVVASETDAAGALAGSVLARANLGPVLLTPPSFLPAAVKAEVTRLDPLGAYVIGNEISPAVLTALADAGVPEDKIIRLAGATPADTARAIAEKTFDRSTEAVIVNPASPESSAVSALAASRRLPVLFVGQSSVPPATSTAFAALGITKTLVVGSPAAISPTLDAQFPAPTRIGGVDAATTSQAVLRQSVARLLPQNIVYVADTNKPMDGAILGAAVARAGGLMLLAPNADPAAAEAFLSSPTATSVGAAAALRPAVDRLVVVRGTGLAPAEPGAAAAPSGTAAAPAAAAAAAPAVNPFASGTTAAGRSGSKSRLAATGVTIGLLLALAVAAIVVGRTMVRRRRQGGEIGA